MANKQFNLSRRDLLGALAAVGGLAAAGCSPSTTPEEDSADRQPAALTDDLAKPAAMTVYRDPSCGCCEAWAEIARKAGYEVNVVDHPDMAVIKRQYGVPEELLSCHTAVSGGYAIEGHVPLADVKRLLAARPAALKGIAVAGMPLGSPGMEVPDGRQEPFQVMAFDAAGRITPFE